MTSFDVSHPSPSASRQEPNAPLENPPRCSPATVSDCRSVFVLTLVAADAETAPAINALARSPTTETVESSRTTTMRPRAMDPPLVSPRLHASSCDDSPTQTPNFGPESLRPGCAATAVDRRNVRRPGAGSGGSARRRGPAAHVALR